MKNNNEQSPAPGPDQNKEKSFMRCSNEWFPGEGSWTEFDNSFIQLLTGVAPARKYFSHHEIEQQITF